MRLTKKEIQELEGERQKEAPKMKPQEKKIRLEDLDWSLKRIIDHLNDLTFHAENQAKLTQEQKDRIFKAGQEIADVVYEKHFGHKRLEVL